jgi:hypothetical protein
MRQGFVPARRQIIEVIAQAERHAAPEGFFIDFATNTAPSDLPESLRSDLRTAAESARPGAALALSPRTIQDHLKPAGRPLDWPRLCRARRFRRH